MKPYEIRITKQARKDIDKLTSKLKLKLRDVLTEIIAENPYEGKKLLGDLEGSYSYRLSYKDRVVYSIDEKRRIVYLERARTHYGE
jgi:mRNA-degrading endonuclease RelE of RelBE toxin-antitoxin system